MLAVPHFSKVAAKELKADAVVRRCSVKKGFLQISQIHRKTPVPESFFYSLKPETSLKQSL